MYLELQNCIFLFINYEVLGSWWGFQNLKLLWFGLIMVWFFLTSNHTINEILITILNPFPTYRNFPTSYSHLWLKSTQFNVIWLANRKYWICLSGSKPPSVKEYRSRSIMPAQWLKAECWVRIWVI